MWKSKRPKLKFDLTINDLSNIPHTSGHCYLKIQIADGSQSGIIAIILQLKPFSLELDDFNPGELSSFPLSGSFSSYGSRSISLRSLNFKIHNFKCHFNLKVSYNLRFRFRCKENMIGDKFLTIRIFYAAEKSSKLEHPVQLGVVKLNLAEYLNFDETVTAKYLLQESKVNSILNLTTKFEELPSDFDFRTELRIDESKLSQTSPSSLLTFCKLSDSNFRSFKIPQKLQKKVFGGLDGVMNVPSWSGANSEQSIHDDNKNAQKDHVTTTSSGELSRQDLGSHSLENVMVDPIMGNLYRRVLESTWDPDLHALLKLTPEKIVQESFLDSDHNGNVEKNLEFYRSLTASYEEESNQDKTGLLVEAKVRDNFKSWSVSWA